jgi:hypothetical protein
LSALHQAVKQQFAVLGTQQREVRAAVLKMEGSLIGRLVQFQEAEHGR